MAHSSESTVAEYLSSLPLPRRREMNAVRKVIRKNLPRGYQEKMGFGMICYEIPLKTFSETYNGKPLMYAALAAQKNAYSLYLMGCYASAASLTRLKAAFKKAGKPLDMGKSCVRFRAAEELPLQAIGKEIASCTPAQLIAFHEKARKR